MATRQGGNKRDSQLREYLAAATDTVSFKARNERNSPHPWRDCLPLLALILGAALIAAGIAALG